MICSPNLFNMSVMNKKKKTSRKQPILINTRLLIRFDVYL